ncbi:MAG: PilN domain-containing protein [Nitrospirota bacterium]
MIRINLLPVRRRRVEESIRKEVSIFFLLLGLSLAVMGYLHVAQTGEIEQMTQEKKRLSEEITRHQARQKELKDLETRKKLLLQKLEIIDSLQANRDLVVRVLEQLASTVPSDKMWFRRIGQQGSTLTLEGVARGNETIAQFMETLAKSPCIDPNRVVLQQSRQEVVEGYKLKAFQLTCQVMAPKKAAEQKQPPAPGQAQQQQPQEPKAPSQQQQAHPEQIKLKRNVPDAG